MHGRGREGVVDLKLEEETAKDLKPHAAPNATEDGSPGLDNVSAAGDGDKADESSVAAVDDAPGLLESEAKDELSQGTSSSREGSGDGSTGSNGGRDDIINHKRRAWVEAIPAKPEDDCSKDNKDSRVSRHVHRLTRGIKTSKTGTHEDSTNKATSSSNHMHNTGAGKVDEAAVEEPLGAAGGARSKKGEPSLS